MEMPKISRDEPPPLSEAVVHRQLTLRGQDLVAILVAGRWMFVVVFAITVAAIVVTLSLMPNVYRSVGQVQIGQVKRQYIEPPSEVIRKIRGLAMPGIVAIERRGGVIEFQASGHTPEASREALRNAVSYLVRDHSPLAEAQGSYYRDVIDEFEAERQAVQKLLAELLATRSPENIAETAEAEAQIRLTLGTLFARRAEYDQKLQLELQPTRLVNPTTRLEDLPLPELPARPRTAHYLVALALGFIFALAAAFLAGYLALIRRGASGNAEGRR